MKKLTDLLHEKNMILEGVSPIAVANRKALENIIQVMFSSCNEDVIEVGKYLRDQLDSFEYDARAIKQGMDLKRDIMGHYNLDGKESAFRYTVFRLFGTLQPTMSEREAAESYLHELVTHS